MSERVLTAAGDAEAYVTQYLVSRGVTVALAAVVASKVVPSFAGAERSPGPRGKDFLFLPDYGGRSRTTTWTCSEP